MQLCYLAANKKTYMTVVDSALYENDAVACNQLLTTKAELRTAKAELRTADAKLRDTKSQLDFVNSIYEVLLGTVIGLGVSELVWVVVKRVRK